MMNMKYWITIMGMFSGIKTTDLTNTLLNNVYVLLALWALLVQYNLRIPDLYRIHQGDDVWMSSLCLFCNALLYMELNGMGLITQDHKQTFGKMLGEYLRVIYHAGWHWATHGAVS